MTSYNGRYIVSDMSDCVIASDAHRSQPSTNITVGNLSAAATTTTNNSNWKFELSEIDWTGSELILLYVILYIIIILLSLASVAADIEPRFGLYIRTYVPTILLYLLLYRFQYLY